MISPTNRKSKVWSVVRVSSGNFLEMYDFMVFGYYASAIGNAFFPGGNPFVSLMLSLMTFGAGFLMRPLGAIVLGAYTDRHGRRAGLILTLGLMSIGIISIACTPGYATIGLLAPLLVLTGRLLQGFSAGMELGGVSVYLAEIATPGHKGFYVSWQSASQQVAVMFAALLGVVLSSVLPPQKMFGIVPGMRYGWPKNILHWAGIQQSILDICATVSVQFVIADGIIAMEGNGPLNGSQRHLGKIVISNDPVAADATCALLMGFEPNRIAHIREASRFLGNSSTALTDQVGEPLKAPGVPFQVVPDWEYLHYSM